MLGWFLFLFIEFLDNLFPIVVFVAAHSPDRRFRRLFVQLSLSFELFSFSFEPQPFLLGKLLFLELYQFLLMVPKLVLEDLVNHFELGYLIQVIASQMFQIFFHHPHFEETRI